MDWAPIIELTYAEADCLSGVMNLSAISDAVEPAITFSALAVLWYPICVRRTP